MIFDTLTLIKATLMGTTAVKTAIDKTSVNLIKDAEGNDVPVRWQQADPRKIPPERTRETNTYISIGLRADLDNLGLMRTGFRIYSPLTHNLTRISRSDIHPEARLLQFQVSVRSEGELAEPNVIKTFTDVRRRLRHRSHIYVKTDIYRDTRIFSIPSHVLIVSTNMSRPDGVVRREFTYDMVYTVDSWILFPETRREYKTVEQINLCLADDNTNETLETIQLTL